MQTQVLNYRVLLRREPEGAFTAIVPSLPGCVTCGGTMDEAIAMANEAIAAYIESLNAHGEPIPTEKDVFEYVLAVETHA